eukprot:13922022-Heterocapsa_arctica.AAC.1
MAAPMEAVSSALKANSIGEVLQLISDLQTKFIGKGEASQKLYAEYAEWCEDRSKDIGFEIKTGEAS